jgi:hypothetical protein
MHYFLLICLLENSDIFYIFDAKNFVKVLFKFYNFESAQK